jgi:hypothetical protein
MPLESTSNHIIFLAAISDPMRSEPFHLIEAGAGSANRGYQAESDSL